MEEMGGYEERVEEEMQERGKGGGFSLEEEGGAEEGEEEEEDEQEEGEDEEEEEEGLEEETGRGCHPSMPPSSPLSPPSHSKSTPMDVAEAQKVSNGEYYEEEDEEDGNEDEDDDYEDGSVRRPPKKKQKSLTSLITASSPSRIASGANIAASAGEALPLAGSSTALLDASAAAGKKSKKKSNNVWKKSASRKSKKKGKSGIKPICAPEDKVLITPIPRFPDKSDDSPDATICLSRVYKAEKVELSEDRLTAGSTKGYRMVRATRGVVEGAWFFEINVVRLGDTGHTRLGWTTDKGDLQAPVGYDGNSFGYRDVDGTKIHKALREKYGDEGYAESDVIGFYINLPDGASYAPKPPHLVWYKGQRYMYSADGKDEPPKVVPGSEISFFKNGICQGTAFTDLFGGRYYPAASMYTLPNQPNCEVRFNFGPSFQFFPEDFGGRPIPKPMIEVPYHGYGGKVEGREENGVSEKKQVNGSSS